MSGSRFWQRVDPRRLAAAAETLEGDLPLIRLSRLAPLLMDTGGDVRARLAFHDDVRGAIRIEGNVSGSLPLTCQRCLERFDLALDARIRLLMARDGAEPAGDRAGFESLSPVAELVPARVVEDELLLTLPLVPMHPDKAACRGLKNPAGAGEDASRQKSPFAVLEGLKRSS